MNLAPSGKSPGSGRIFPDDTRMATSGHPWCTSRANSKPLIEPGMSTSVKISSTSAPRRKISKASSAVVASRRRKPPPRRISASSSRTRGSSSTIRTRGFFGTLRRGMRRKRQPPPAVPRQVDEGSISEACPGVCAEAETPERLRELKLLAPDRIDAGLADDRVLSPGAAAAAERADELAPDDDRDAARRSD